jgi:hypothetical protein
MPAPTFVATYTPAVGFQSSASPKTISVTCADNDALVVVACSEGGTVLTTPTGQSGFSWTSAQSIAGGGSNGEAEAWTATVGAGQGQTFTCSVTNTASGVNWGYLVYRFSSHGGIGASNKAQTTGGPTVSLTTTAANSAVVAVNGDWAAVDGATRTWRTVNSVTPTAGNSLETLYSRNASNFTAYSAYWNDAGTAGANNYGLSAPTGQTYSLIAVEVKGTVSAGGATILQPVYNVPPVALHHSTSW